MGTGTPPDEDILLKFCYRKSENRIKIDMVFPFDNAETGW